MTEFLAKYTPQAVFVPDGAHVERSFAGYEISDEVRALCDRTTIFCDVLRPANTDEVVCIGPPFSDFGYPHTVRLLRRRRRFVVEEAPWGPRRMSILRVLGTSDVSSADNPDVGLQVDFPAFGIDVQVRLPRTVPRPHVALTLAVGHPQELIISRHSSTDPVDDDAVAGRRHGWGLSGDGVCAAAG